MLIKINNNNIPCTCQVCLFEMAFQKQSNDRQRTIFDCLDANQLYSSASKRQTERQQHCDETNEQEIQLVSNDIRTTNDGFNSCMYKCNGVLERVPDDIAVSPELFVFVVLFIY